MSRARPPRPSVARTTHERYRNHSITYTASSGLYSVSREQGGPQLRLAFSASHARHIVDGLIAAEGERAASR